MQAQHVVNKVTQMLSSLFVRVVISIDYGLIRAARIISSEGDCLQCLKLGNVSVIQGF